LNLFPSLPASEFGVQAVDLASVVSVDVSPSSSEVSVGVGNSVSVIVQVVDTFGFVDSGEIVDVVSPLSIDPSDLSNIIVMGDLFSFQDTS
jgi:hypothetical protein